MYITGKTSRTIKMTPDNSITSLHSFLKELPTGEIQDSDAVCSLLQDCWDLLEGSHDEKTFSTKIQRAEGMSWNPPILSFALERHGGTVNGSSRADLHYWYVDVEQGTASIETGKYRQLRPELPRMDTNVLAKEVAERILNRLEHSTLEWNTEQDYVVIKISEIIPTNASAQTTTARRKRFNNTLEAIMVENKWIRRNKGQKTGYFREKLNRT